MKKLMLFSLLTAIGAFLNGCVTHEEEPITHRSTVTTTEEHHVIAEPAASTTTTIVH